MTKPKWDPVPGGLRGPTHRKRMVTKDGLVVEVWKHPRWSPALQDLKKGNPKAIGKLLRSGDPVPQQIAKELAAMLDPTSAYKGPRLEVRGPKRWTIDSLAATDGEKRKVRKEIEAAHKKFGGKLEAAIAHVAAKRKAQGKPYSRRYLVQCWKLTDSKIVRRSQRYLGLAG